MNGEIMNVDRREKSLSTPVVGYSLAYLSVHKWLVGNVPFYLKFSTKVAYPVQKLRYPPCDLTLRRPAYLRLVYHIQYPLNAHMPQCVSAIPIFWQCTSISQKITLFTFHTHSITDAFTNISPQPITKWAPWAVTNQLSDSQTYT